jgi:hypothetical protein
MVETFIDDAIADYKLNGDPVAQHALFARLRYHDSRALDGAAATALLDGRQASGHHRGRASGCPLHQCQAYQAARSRW